MEPSTAIAVATATVTYLKPHLETLLTNAASEGGKAVPTIIRSIWQSLLPKLEGKAAAKEAAEDAAKAQAGELEKSALIQQVRKMLEADTQLYTESNNFPRKNKTQATLTLTNKFDHTFMLNDIF